MDIFKQKRNLVLTIVFLVILNIVTLSLLWFGRPQSDLRKGPRGSEQNTEHIQKLLKEELGFNNNQAEKYIAIRDKHRKNTRHLNEEIRKLKKEMFDQALQNNDQAMISDSLLNLAQEKQSQIEKLTFQQFLNLKKICNPEQNMKLQKLMHRLLAPPHLDRHGEPPPPPRGERPPPFEN
jgi:Spy/CpxP family protein refolding chaperone